MYKCSFEITSSGSNSDTGIKLLTPPLGISAAVIYFTTPGNIYKAKKIYQCRACTLQLSWSNTSSLNCSSELIVLQQIIIWLVGGSIKQNQTRSETSLFYEDHSVRNFAQQLPTPRNNNRVCKRMQHVTSNNFVGSFCPTILRPFACSWSWSIQLTFDILTWLRGLLVIFINVVWLSLCSSLLCVLRDNGAVKKLQFCP